MSSSLVHQSKSDIAKGSKSFSMASFFFSKNEKEAAWKLYAWCRHCDDVIDSSESLQQAQSRVQDLIEKTAACYSGKPPQQHPWPAFYEVIKEFQIPAKYPLDLLRGFQMDSNGAKIPDRGTLFDYCYCVAGTVGLMMCHIMSVNAPQALDHAVALGRAMQLTNIARDIQEDFALGRVYLPTTWLEEAGLSESNFLDSKNRPQLQVVVKRLIDEAGNLYFFGAQGLQYLSLRSAWAVCIALNIYRDIGEQVLRFHSYDKRIIVSKSKKLFLVFRASLSMLPFVFFRIQRPWKPTMNLGLWSDI